MLGCRQSGVMGERLSWLASADVNVIRVRRSFATFAEVFEAKKVGGPFGGAVVHKLDLLLPAALREEQDGLAIFL